MAGGTRIIAFEAGVQTPEDEEFLLSEELAETETEQSGIREEPDDPPVTQRNWLWPTLAIGSVAAWTAFFLWTKQGETALLSAPAQWPGLVAEWTLPVLLVGMTWLIFMRNSRREAIRFGETARILSDESARLEQRLVVVNRELSLAREFVASQSRDLDALGRIAVERLSSNSQRLEALIQDNGARIESIGTVSEAALDNMEKLRGQLPVIASSAKDVTNNIANAGRTAHTQLGEMLSGFERLNSFGQASERQVLSFRQKVDDALAEFSRQSEQLDSIATNRFAALAERGAAFRNQLEIHDADSVSAIQARAASLAEEVAQTRQQLDAQEAESLTSLRARLSALRDEGGAMSRAIRDGEARSLESWHEAISRIDEELRNALASLETAENRAVENARARLDALGHDTAAIDQQIAERRAGHEQQSAALAAQSQAISNELAGFERYLAQIIQRTGEAEAGIAASVQNLAAKLGESRSLLTGTDREIAQLTDAGVRLLEILQASKQQTRDELPEALVAGEQRLAAFESRILALHGAVIEAGEHGSNLSARLQASETELRAAFAAIEELQTNFGRNSAAHGDKLVELRQMLTDIGAQSAQLADDAQGELSSAIEKLLTAANEAVATIGHSGTQAVSRLASQLGEESTGAIKRAMRQSAADVTGQLENAASQAASVSREAALQLRDQLGKVNELVGNLERRVAHARQRAEEQVDNDFSRRAALITESLNSNAIDIAKALSSDVADTAWSAYLRGDRGIFTRRAVSLIDSGDAKAIVQVFEQDADFREHVSRYIHDFEAILRQVLSTRDGHALGITLLSSDMGKLYVALAQAIDRLRG
jgi:DNA repair exonuclease SbcCD ATPase subunit